MSFDATLRGIVAALLFALGVPAAFLLWKVPAPLQTSAEKELASFAKAPLLLPPQRVPVQVTGLECPVWVTAAKKPAAKLPAQGPAVRKSAASSALAPKRRDSFGRRPNISMIYCEGSIKTAIIDGRVVQEGSHLGESLVVSIEKTRVLLRTAQKELWLSTEP
jgi:hypothetical protein